MSANTKANNTGVWIAGARGDIASTLIVGVEALKQQQISTNGMTTEIPPISNLDLVKIDELFIGGIDILDRSLVESARTIAERSGTFSTDLVDRITPALVAIDQDIVCEPQAAWKLGAQVRTSLDLTSFITKLRKHLCDFAAKHQLSHTVVVNLASAESLPVETHEHDTLEGMERLITDNRLDQLTPSMCYTYAALKEGCTYINFTPNPGIDLPGLQELADRKQVPYYGNDGKTGETLVKTALAPMFLYRNLKVLSWEGVNMLGNDDGRTLRDPDHRIAKLHNKANVLDSILGYSPHAGIDINYVPSLGDWKTAWDLIHFEGFFDVKMFMQFTWQGCDSILAAPLVLDLIRLGEYAARHNESGPMTHLAAFFKNPLHCDEMALYPQFQRLLEYTQTHLAEPKSKLVDANLQ